MNFDITSFPPKETNWRVEYYCNYNTRPSKEEEEKHALALSRWEAYCEALKEVKGITDARLQGLITLAAAAVPVAEAAKNETQAPLDAEEAAIHAEYDPKIAIVAGISKSAARGVERDRDEALREARDKYGATVNNASKLLFAAQVRLQTLEAEAARRAEEKAKRQAWLEAEAKKRAEAEAAAEAKETARLAAIAARMTSAGIKAVAVVGSCADGDFREGSDIDAVVVFHGEATEKTVKVAVGFVEEEINKSRKYGRVELHKEWCQFPGSESAIMLFGAPEDIPTTTPDLTDPGTALRYAAAQWRWRGNKGVDPVNRVPIESLALARPATLAAAFGYIERRGIPMSRLLTLAGEPLDKEK
jgi:predicted nucleotidyltransferase